MKFRENELSTKLKGAREPEETSPRERERSSKIHVNLPPSPCLALAFPAFPCHPLPYPAEHQNIIHLVLAWLTSY